MAPISNKFYIGEAPSADMTCQSSTMPLLDYLESNRRRMKVSRMTCKDFMFQGMYLGPVWEDRLSSPRLLKPCQDTMTRVLSLLETSVAKTHMNDSLPMYI